MTISIRPLTDSDLSRFRAHFQRHRMESGRDGDAHFMPFAPGDRDGPRGLDPGSLSRGLDQIGWQRWWIAVDENEVVGHVNLKGDGLKAGLHRCELGIGLERSHRGAGNGRRLMESAIEYARGEPSLAWIDLRVFAHNVAGQGLYESLGFREIGKIVDRFRIEGARIDDVIMALNVE